MSKQKYAIPKKGVMHRFPGEPRIILPDKGGYVPWVGPKGRYWRRRLKEGTIKITDKAPIVKVAKPKLQEVIVEKEKGGKHD